jgi:23S rRNA (cytidine1920-2'-O)/16S rRNA (cytidine1409-2'-O)-methyltransferase
LDQVLVLKKLAASRTQAQELIKEGFVFVQQKMICKPNFEVTESLIQEVNVIENKFQKFVSRAGLKLEAALHHLQLDVSGKIVLDVGQSTGGFTDCLIQRNANRVVGIDVGHDQIHENFKNHERVTIFEGLNAKDLLAHGEFNKCVPEAGFDLIVVDVSFISLTKVMPFLKNFLKKDAYFLFLVKPQFEAGSNALDKNGIVKDEKYERIVQNSITEESNKIFGTVIDYFKSDLQGKDGNQEFFIYGQNSI